MEALLKPVCMQWDLLASLNLIAIKRNHIDVKRRSKDVRDAVSEFLNACGKLPLKVTLIDQKILGHLLERIERFSKDGRTENDGHGGCHYFCSQNVITFGTFEPTFEDKMQWERFSELVSIMNFKTDLLSGPDKRQATLESVGEFPSILSHAVFYRRKVIIHLVMFHNKRHDHWWSSTCQPKISNRRLEYYWRFLKKSSFCTQEHILPRVLSTTTQLDGLSVSVPLYIKKFAGRINNSIYINCDYSRARKFYSKYGRDESEDAEVFRLKAKNLLNQVKFALDQLGVPFWLSSGTCLGWFRQCDFIPHSKDVDIGIWIKDYNPKISDAMQKSGLVPKHIFGKLEDSLELSFRTPSNDLKLDIFFFYEEGDTMWNGGTQAKTGKKFKYRFPKFTICWTEFVDILVRVPCNTIDYIKANYGPSWNILVKEWDWKKSPSNVEENGQWPSDELAKVVQVFQ
eukprot:gene2067-17634_t